MVGETIGDSKCQCIMPFDKHQLLKALDEAIERQDKEINRVKISADEIRKNELLTPEKLIDIHERIKRDFQIVWKRTENTPTCK